MEIKYAIPEGRKEDGSSVVKIVLKKRKRENYIDEGEIEEIVVWKTYPQATRFPDGAYEQAMIQVVGILIACSW